VKGWSDKENTRETLKKKKNHKLIHIHFYQIFGTKLLRKGARGECRADAGPMPTSFQKTFRSMLPAQFGSSEPTCASGIATGILPFSFFMDNMALPSHVAHSLHQAHTIFPC
jgi:hypothetical protein